VTETGLKLEQTAAGVCLIGGKMPAAL